MASHHENPGGPSFHGSIVKGRGIARPGYTARLIDGVGGIARENGTRDFSSALSNRCHLDRSSSHREERSGETPVFVLASRYPEASASGLSTSQRRKGAGSPRLQPRVSPGISLSKILLAGLVILPLTGCHHKPPRVAHHAPPPITRPNSSQPPSSSSETATITPAPRPNGPAFDDTSGPPIYTEVGIASWYGPNYNRRAAADGTVYDQDGMTAAHRTLPLGTTVRVTNLATGQQAYVRITDRGPFAKGRILDLSVGAAKAIGLYRAGLGKVRVEAFAHTSADPPGRWCVQTGPFTKEHDARDLKAALLDRYKGAKVAEFQGPTGFWVRIDPADHARADALAIQDWIGDPDPTAAPYLVRID